MKSLIYLLLLSIVLTSFSSCISNKPLVKGKAENNETYEVGYLFEHDGCKVYRFSDAGRYIYFTNCTGDVTAITNDSIASQTYMKVRGQR